MRPSPFAIRHHRANGVGVWVPVAVGQGPTLLAGGRVDVREIRRAGLVPADCRTMASLS